MIIGAPVGVDGSLISLSDAAREKVIGFLI
jgi:precorrin-3B methylase